MTGLIGILIAVILIQGFFLWDKERQVKDICRQLSFLMKHDSNLLLAKESERGAISNLVEILNAWLELRRKEKQAYRKKDRMISDTYTNLSHDIRTPLTSLDGYFQLMESSEDEEEQKRYLRIIQERIGSLKEMLEELFTFTKLKNETFWLELSPCCVTRILKNTIFSYYEEWSSRGIEPVIHISEELLWVEGNEAGIRRTIQNILKNALDHGEKKLQIALGRIEDQVVLQIRNAVRCPEEIDVSQVFERFYKADEARSKTSNGLGLSIAKEFVQRMHGEIRAYVEDGEFCVEVSLPEQKQSKSLTGCKKEEA